MKLVLQFLDFSTIYTELNMFQPLEIKLATAICRKPLRISLFFTHPPLPLCSSLTGGVSYFFSPSPLCSRPRPRRQNGGATSLAGSEAPRLPALGQRLAWRHKVAPSSPFPPLAGQPTGAGPGRPQLQLPGHGGAPVSAIPALPLHRDQCKEHPHPPRNMLKQVATPRSGRTQGPRGGAMVLRRTAAQAMFLPKPRRPSPTLEPRSTTSPRIARNKTHLGLIPLLQQGSPEGVGGGAQNPVTV
jgi:hypothetical protein